MKCAWAVWSIAVLTACVSRSALGADDKGTISGTIDRPAEVTEVRVVNRATDKVFKGKVDAKSCQFSITDLPLDATYDCIVDAATVRLEGVNLKVPRSDFEEEQPLSKEDIEAITKAAKHLNKFENQVEVMTIR